MRGRGRVVPGEQHRHTTRLDPFNHIYFPHIGGILGWADTILEGVDGHRRYHLALFMNAFVWLVNMEYAMDPETRVVLAYSSRRVGFRQLRVGSMCHIEFLQVFEPMRYHLYLASLTEAINPQSHYLPEWR